MSEGHRRKKHRVERDTKRRQVFAIERNTISSRNIFGKLEEEGVPILLEIGTPQVPPNSHAYGDGQKNDPDQIAVNRHRNPR